MHYSHIYQLYHARRGGSHGFMVWLLKHFNSAVFSNGRPQPIKSFNPSLVWRLDADSIDCNEDGFIKPDSPLGDKENWIVPTGHECYLISHEDTLPLGPTPDVFLRQNCLSRELHPDPFVFRILLLRSVYNNLASRLQMNKRRAVKVTACYDENSIDVWKRLARRALHPEPGEFYVSYDRWCTERDYRRELEDTFSLHPYTDDEDRMVANFAATGFLPSSFDRLKFQGRALEMNLMRRFEQIELPAEVLSDDELRDLNRTFFGWYLTKTGEVVGEPDRPSGR
jgi:hypothetical protein